MVQDIEVSKRLKSDSLTILLEIEFRGLDTLGSYCPNSNLFEVQCFVLYYQLEQVRTRIGDVVHATDDGDVSQGPMPRRSISSAFLALYANHRNRSLLSYSTFRGLWYVLFVPIIGIDRRTEDV